MRNYVKTVRYKVTILRYSISHIERKKHCKKKKKVANMEKSSICDIITRFNVIILIIIIMRKNGTIVRYKVAIVRKKSHVPKKLQLQIVIQLVKL